VVEEEVVII